MKRWQVIALIVGISLGGNLAFNHYEHDAAKESCRNIRPAAQKHLT